MITIDKPPTDEKLVEYAIEARQRAYAPYSNYKVGSAIYATHDGLHYVIQGCNVENASYGLTICAERSACCHALSNMTNLKFNRIAIITKDGKGFPCGACRQFLNEFNPSLEIIIADPEGKITARTDLNELLPSSFGPHSLK